MSHDKVHRVRFAGPNVHMVDTNKRHLDTRIASNGMAKRDALKKRLKGVKGYGK